MDQIFGKIKQAVMSAIHNNWGLDAFEARKHSLFVFVGFWVLVHAASY